jgi:capsular polysaccharide biosynthesis protein
LWDDVPLSILDDDRAAHISVVRKSYEHEPEYRDLLGAPAAPLVEHAHIEELTLFRDFAQNASKEARIRKLRAHIRKQVKPLYPDAPGIYIRRGMTGERRVLENEPEIERYLAGQGFTIIDPTALSAREIAARSLEAKLVIGVEGSHIAHALYTMADDAAFLVLQPPNRFSLVHKEFADRLGMRYSFIVGEPSAQGFSVRLDDLKAMLDRLL